MQKPTTRNKTNGAPPLPGGVRTLTTTYSNRLWDDEEFRDQLTRHLVFSRDVLERCTEVGLSPDNLKPQRGMRNGMERWMVDERAIEHFGKHGEPIGKLFRADVLDHAQRLGTGAERIAKLKAYCDLLSKLTPAPSAFVIEKVVPFMSQIRKAEVLDELTDLQASGQLTDEKWMEVSQRAVSASRDDAEEPPVAQWPAPLGQQAYHGLAGDVIRAIEPHTESDVAALLIQFLLAFGNVIGRRAHWKVEATKHHLNLFAVLVGQTSKARKGTSLDRVLDLFLEVDPDWLAKRRMGGLSSGEGLIQQVRDEVRGKRPSKKGGVASQEDGVVIDPGEPDKRLLIVEPEFARVLKVGEREASTLSSIIRDAWDKGDVRTLTRESPLRATGAHVSLVAHVTEEELQRTLSDTNRCNGFANRFLWACVRRSKALPLGGSGLAPKVRGELVGRLRDAVQHAATIDRMVLGARARPLWISEYSHLSEGLPGMLGSATDRAEAQVRRLACLYALLDCDSFVREEHLRGSPSRTRYSRNCDGAARRESLATRFARDFSARTNAPRSSGAR